MIRVGFLFTPQKRKVGSSFNEPFGLSYACDEVRSYVFFSYNGCFFVRLSVDSSILRRMFVGMRSGNWSIASWVGDLEETFEGNEEIEETFLRFESVRERIFGRGAGWEQENTDATS